MIKNAGLVVTISSIITLCKIAKHVPRCTLLIRCFLSKWSRADAFSIGNKLFLLSNVVRKYSSLTPDFSGVSNLETRTLAKRRRAERRARCWKR